MNQNNEKNDQIDRMMESYYSYIGYCHTENIVRELGDKKNEINQIEIPLSLDEWFNKFSKKHRRKNNVKNMMRNIQKIGKKIAILIIIVLTIGTILTCTVEAFRIKLFNFFMEKHEKYTSIQIDEDRGSIIPSSWNNYYYPKYLPEGFRVSNAEMLNDEKIIEFINDEKFILMMQSPNGSNYQVDTEQSENEKIIINENKGLLIEKGERIIIIWHNEECSFSFTSNITSIELIEVIKSLEKNKNIQ